VEPTVRVKLAIAFALAATFLSAPARAGDDPEPPGKGGALLHKLKGKWTAVRQVAKGRERKDFRLTYEFDGDKLTLDNGSTKTVFKVKVDARHRPAVLERIGEGKEAWRLYFKIEKGELYLAGDFGPSKAGKDFSGKSGSMAVMRREKK
jgi:uncharacterized protein (TIGR03067 family)